MRYKLLLVALFTISQFSYHNLYSLTYTVNTNADAGAGSLREAITLANARPGPDIIEFNLGTAGVKTITLLSALPAIEDELFIDGSSDPFYAGSPLIEINANGQENGLLIDRGADYSRVHALIVNNATLNTNSAGINIQWADHVSVTGCYIGTDATGTLAVPNSQAGVYAYFANRFTLGGTGANEGNLISGNGGYGVFFWFADTASVYGNLVGTDETGANSIPNAQGMFIWHCQAVTIGGNTAAHRNIVSGNTNSGIQLSSGGSHNVYGNYIGTDINGTVAVPNGVGVHVQVDSSNVGGILPGQGNLISGNSQHGITIFATNEGENTVKGNLIGTDVSGLNALPNQTHGINFHAVSKTTIGGLVPEARNILSGNGGSGISVFDSDTTYIVGNYIGTDITGVAALPNQQSGIRIFAAFHTYIGNASPTGANVISGNMGEGIRITGTGANPDSTIIQYNFIGTDATGLVNLANSGYGISIGSNAVGNKIGGTAPGAGNIITNNLQGGVMVNGATAINNMIYRNSIFANTGPGIRLNNGNYNQVAPDLTGFAAGPGNTSIFGNFTSAPNTTYRLEFFTSNGYGQGKTFIGTTTITTDAGGAYLLNEVVPVTLTAAEPVLSATATDPAGNTSAFGIETVLDAELSSFSAEALPNRSALLNWEIPENDQPYLFEIEHHSAGEEFKQVGQQQEYLSFSESRRYEFQVKDLKAEIHHFRIVQTDQGGLRSYSKSIELDMRQNTPYQISMQNPLEAHSSMRISLERTQSLKVFLVDMKGQKVANIFSGKLEAGAFQEIPLKGLGNVSQGIYSLVILGPEFKINKKVLVK